MLINNQKKLPLLIYLFFWMWAIYAQTDSLAVAEYTVKEVPNVQLEDASQYTTDPQRALSEEARAHINSLAAGLRSDTGVELAVVILPRISYDYADAREFANLLFNHWGIGQKGKDNGLLFLLLTDPEQREIVFEVGYGLEENLPDGLCKLIQTKKMIPLMKDGDYGAGMIAGIEEVEQILKGSSEVKALYEEEQKQEKQENLMIGVGFLALIVFLNIWGRKEFRKSLENIRTNNHKNGYKKLVEIEKKGFNLGCLILLIFFLPIAIMFAPLLISWARNTKRLRKQIKEELECEECNSVNTTELVRTKEEVMANYLLTTYTFRCRNCGHVHTETEKQSNRSRSGFASSGGSRSSWGGSSGGSWGGGRSGGGGASTRF